MDKTNKALIVSLMAFDAMATSQVFMPPLSLVKEGEFT